MIIEIAGWGPVKIVQREEEIVLPDSIDTLFMDFETTSRSEEHTSVNPWHNCWIAGAAITWDDHPMVYYIPIGHSGYQTFSNVDFGGALLTKLCGISKSWCNHNIKYDAHVLYNHLEIDFPGKLIDSLTMAKLCNKTERLTYNLTDLMKAWYHKDISTYEEEIKEYIKKDYGKCPIDKMAPYAAVDVYCVRMMHDSWDKLIASETNRVARMEIEVTRSLLEMERIGIQVDLASLNADLAGYHSMLEVLTESLSDLTGFPKFKAHKVSDCRAYFLERCGLPILGYTKDRNGAPTKEPSFSSDVLQLYKKFPGVNPNVCDLALLYREYYKLLTGFVEPYLKLNVNGVLHCSYNQAVRTGRMSCSDPNLQQASKRAKKYLIPRKGYKFTNFDQSQIEFRTIVHYIEDLACINSYQANPDTDFHDWVSKMCHIQRKPAKTMNFLIGYGGGEKKCVQELQGYLLEEGQSIEDVQQVARNMYRSYHATLPTLKPTSKLAQGVAEQRGFIKTILGRRRYFSVGFEYKAFNTVCQGTAAEIMKDRTVAVSEVLRGTDSHLLAVVHDSWLIESPIETDVSFLREVLETPPEGVDFKVPLRCKSTTSLSNWGDCDD